jgi:hypothetical protein
MVINCISIPYIYIYYAADVVDGLIDCKSKSNVKSIYFQNIRS